MNPEEIKAKAHALAEAGASAEEIERFVQGATQSNIPAPPPVVQADAAKDAAAVVQAPGEGKTGDLDKLRDMGLGLATTAPQAIPGVEAAQAGIRSVARRQPYSEALSDMRHETDAIPLPLKLAVQAPAIAAMGKLPLSPAKAGAALGGFSQLLNADPNQSLEERAAKGTFGAVLGGTAGKALDIVGTGLRAWRPPVGRPTSGAITEKLKDEMSLADRANYGQAAKEGAASPTQIAGVRKILNSKTVKNFAADVRRSGQFSKASDAEVLTETYASMSAAERSLKDALAKEFDPAKARNLADIVDAKRAMLTEADKIMPSFRPATQAHAIAEGGIDAVGTGVDAAKRVMGGTPSGSHLPYESAEAFAARLRAMPPENRKLAVQAIMSELKQRTGFQPNAVSLGGTLTSIQRPMKTAGFLRMAGDDVQKFSDLLTKMAIGAGFGAGR